MHAAIVGAGIAGLACARRLVAAGADVEVFDKGRGPGGRLATRRLDDGQADLGAQYFTARDPAFAECIARWRRDGVVAPWRPALVELRDGRTRPVTDATERWVGHPRMSALTRHLSAGLALRTGETVRGLDPVDGGWRLATSGGRRGPFDRVVLAVPAPQAAALLAGIDGRLANAVGARAMRGCWAAALEVDGTGPGFDAAFVDDAVLGWVAREASKPGRPGGGTWVAHATPAWSDPRIEADPDTVLPELVAAFRRTTGHAGPVIGRVAHRWRYARGPREPGAVFHLERASGLGACGDWCGVGRVEAAWLSGDRLGAALAAG